MPGRDGTGPLGIGPGTGKGFGPCGGGCTVPAHAGYGIGFGCGRGYRRMAYATGQPGWLRCCEPAMAEQTDPRQEKNRLAEHAKFLENQLEQVKQRLKNLETDQPV